MAGLTVLGVLLGMVPTHTSGETCLGHGCGQCPLSRIIPATSKSPTQTLGPLQERRGQDYLVQGGWKYQKASLPLHTSSPHSFGPGWQFVVPQHQAQQPLVDPESRGQGCDVGLAAGLAGCCSLFQQRAQVRHGQAPAQVCLALLGRERVRGVL